MDAASIFARLRCEGIFCYYDRDDVLVASILKPREECWSWALALWSRVGRFQGVELTGIPLVKPTRNSYFSRAEVRFRIAPERLSGGTAPATLGRSGESCHQAGADGSAVRPGPAY